MILNESNYTGWSCFTLTEIDFRNARTLSKDFKPYITQKLKKLKTHDTPVAKTSKKATGTRKDWDIQDYGKGRMSGPRMTAKAVYMRAIRAGMSMAMIEEYSRHETPSALWAELQRLNDPANRPFVVAPILGVLIAALGMPTSGVVLGRLSGFHIKASTTRVDPDDSRDIRSTSIAIAVNLIAITQIGASVSAVCKDWFTANDQQAHHLVD
ncbi:hypothetical protein BJ741DRAFT_710940 [Chytriomyces cf. hyalinus JEL632]|nr:hypothetical protein BJ741DRAFT_710940 [Chytriomyces cf. hyalinus JEL632]